MTALKMNSTSSKALIAGIALAGLLVAPASALEVSDDLPSNSYIFDDETQLYSLQVRNDRNTTTEASFAVSSGLQEVIEQPESVQLRPGEQNKIPVTLNASRVRPDIYSGVLSVNTVEEKVSRPISVQVLSRSGQTMTVDVQMASSQIRPSEDPRFYTVLTSPSEENITVDYSIRNAQTGSVLANFSKEYLVDGTSSFLENVSNKGEYAVDDYYVQSNVILSDKTVTATDTFQVRDVFWTPKRVKITVLLIAIMIVATGGYYTRKWYINKKDEESRYVFPVDYSKLPEESEDNYWVGEVAETSKGAYIDPDDLTTHAIVSGSTGSGKSVTSNVIAEEALEDDVPVVVFDPTAQWTGFVKELQDQDLLDHYDRFDMDEADDPHSYPGIIKEIDSADPDIDFESLRKPGEITVFTLNNLTTDEFDKAVRNIIDQMFERDWEESPTLEMLVVFDEVHRLLESYGGAGGYEALEQGAREFRKWGIGLLMVSQVTADFKQAISGNIMTEMQLQTKSMEDINRVEKKYGSQYSKRISSQDVGTGMIQNSNYNEGEPWFVDFRPTYHDPHKISDEELEKYHKLSSRLDELREKLKEKDDSGDKELELDLAAGKLKEGRFKMAKMYISSLEEDLGKD